MRSDRTALVSAKYTSGLSLNRCRLTVTSVTEILKEHDNGFLPRVGRIK